MSTKLLNAEIAQQVMEVFKQLKNPVQVLFFGRKSGCKYCAETLQLVCEISALSDQLTLSAHDLEDDAALAQQYHVENAPTLVIAGKDGEQLVDFGIRFVGIPSGHEFSSLIHTLLLVSGRDSGLKVRTRDLLKDLQKPIHLLVFVTPT